MEKREIQEWEGYWFVQELFLSMLQSLNSPIYIQPGYYKLQWQSETYNPIHKDINGILSCLTT